MILLKQIASYIRLSKDYISNIAYSASHRYKEFQIPKKSGGLRTIYHPSKELKAIQRVLFHVIKHLPVSENAYAYKSGYNIIDHARVHVKSKYLLRMDILNFFPSITADDIRNYIDKNPAFFQSWVAEDITLFCRLVCRKRILTIGAPTSPGLSNALCFDMDVALQKISAECNIRYTRYAEDLFFSTHEACVLRKFESRVTQAVKDCACPLNLEINFKKTRHSSKRGHRRVTGIVIGSDGQVHIGRKRKRWLRSLVNNVAGLNLEEREFLAGMLAFCRTVEPNLINDLIVKYDVEKVKLARFPERPVQVDQSNRSR